MTMLPCHLKEKKSYAPYSLTDATLATADSFIFIFIFFK